MDRRDMLKGMGAVPLGTGAAALAGSPRQAQGRPPFEWEHVGAGRWRFRSWTDREGAWRPLIGHVTETAAGATVTGRVDPGDAEALRARLATLGSAPV